MYDVVALQSLLEKEVAILTELNSLSLLKKDVLLNDDIDALQQIVLQEEALSGKLKTIENVSAPQVQFFLSGKASAPETIVGLIEEIRRLVKEFKGHNDLNQLLIRDSLGIVQFTLNALLGMNDNGLGVYSAAGKPNQVFNKNTSMLDYKR